MNTDRQVIAAFFRSSNQAERAIEQLHSAGFRADHVGCSFGDNYADNDNYVDSDIRENESGGQHDRSFWQKVGSFFSGDEGYEDRDTGSGDGVTNDGFRVGPTLTVPDRYNERFSSGGCLVTVHDTTRFAEAEQILTHNGGETDRSFGAASMDRDSDIGTRANMTDANITRDRKPIEGERRIQLLSEVLRVNKERVQTGEVRLRKEVRTETQHVEVPVSREEIVIERTPVEGGRTSATGEIGNNEEIRVPLSEERVNVEKAPVVREEVRVGKKAIQENRDVTEKVRREELKVDNDAKRDLDVNNPRRKKSA